MKTVLTVIAVFLFIPSVHAADPNRGKELYEARCTSCHVQMFGGDGSKIHTRADHKMNSLDALGKQVRLCTHNLNINWYDDEIQDVIHHLNTTYYKFK